MARDVGRRAPPALTADGVKRLFDGSVVTGGVLVQVLGIYRYLVDPALKAWVGPELALRVERDAFDLLVSDGRLKMKCLLSPALSHLVWKRRVQPLDVISISKFEALEQDMADDNAGQQRVCVVHKLSVVSNAVEVKKKIVRPRSEDRAASDALEFISADHFREVGLLPLVGERRYYLPLCSDHFSLDRADSFTGKGNKWSPFSELEDGQEHSNVEWTKERDECQSLFTKSFRKIYTISEVKDAISAAGADPNRASLPPMVGTIRVKSKVTHLGDPDVSSEFPFAFHIVLVDCTSAVEVAFYGSMCARYFLSLQEGDLVQLRGYKAVQPGTVDDAYADSSLVYLFEHKSAGSVFHVPEKYWKMLEASHVIPAPIPMQESDNGMDESELQKAPQRPRWLELSFVSTLNVQFWSEQTIEDRERLYFDFVGVLSFVGKVCRRRKRRRTNSIESSSEEESNSGDVFTEYRWVKAIDNSSSYELVILIEECSQPVVFRSLAAGDFFMVTKLQWVVLGPNEERAIQYAATSSFSVMRVKDDISPFLGIEECRLNAFFARTINDKAEHAIVKTRGESRLEGDKVKEYKLANGLPTDVNVFMKLFNVAPLSFSQLRKLHDSMETFECQHVAVIAPVRSILSRGVPTVKREANVFMELGDLDDLDMRLTVRVAVNPLFQPTALLDMDDPTPLAESLPLMRIMSPSMLQALYCRAVAAAEGRSPPHGNPAGHRLSVESLKLNSICEWMSTPGKKSFFSLRLFRSSRGQVEWEVDAVFPAP